MTLKQLETRVEQLEKAVEELQRKMNGDANEKKAWWITEAGIFKDDPIFDEVVRLGREYRESLRPGRKKRNETKTKRKNRK